MNKYQLVYITTANSDEAASIGRALVEKRLAACVNIINPMSSIYWWEGKVEQGEETILLVKTLERHLSRLTAEVKRLHSYDCPCVAVLDIRADVGNGDYLQWIANEARVT